MANDVQDRVRSTFRKVFQDPDMEVSRSMTAADVADWDSLNHINLIVAIEREFKIRFTTAEVAGLKNAGHLIDLILRKAQ
jgi:acyl carrier protein